MALGPNDDFRFIAFSLLTEFAVAHSVSAFGAYDLAVMGDLRRCDERFLEIIDCERRGRDIWNRKERVGSVRARWVTVFRGDGMAPTLPALELGLVSGGQERVEADLLFYGKEVERLRIELRRCGVWQETLIRRQVEAAEAVVKALLLLKLQLAGGK